MGSEGVGSFPSSQTSKLITGTEEKGPMDRENFFLGEKGGTKVGTVVAEGPGVRTINSPRRPGTGGEQGGRVFGP
ncbi:hypothetical protein GWI33_007510 [Rhynchophorus ferrugineus]|uniref:Uncharacterized protein n=1 Tax=Rhynchophorus ferrugineus TaxID=354439 RepID=A0A834IIS7_RHYFE|nr:hypothetical protein GWI33_007510 [Rhynchophorus ferrugineus]